MMKTKTLVLKPQTMKNLFLMVAAAVVIALTGCDKDDPKADYNVILKVTNQTDKEIELVNALGITGNDMLVKIAPGTSGTTTGKLYSGPAESSEPQQDYFDAEDILPFGNALATQLPEGEYWVDMTVGGEAVSGKIWTRKYWTFSSDNFNRTYSLTVTNEFLAEIGTPTTI